MWVKNEEVKCEYCKCNPRACRDNSEYQSLDGTLNWIPECEKSLKWVEAVTDSSKSKA